MRWFEILALLAILSFGACAYLAMQAMDADFPTQTAFDTYIRRIATMILVAGGMFLIMMRHTRAWIKTAGALLLAAFTFLQSLSLWLRVLQPDLNSPMGAVELDGGGVTLVSSLDIVLAAASAVLGVAFILVFAAATMLRMTQGRNLGP
jgi:hypothetical protein